MTIKETTYSKSNYFCPSCGKQAVWKEEPFYGGDYYLGVDYICLACEKSHMLDNSGSEALYGVVNKIKSALKLSLVQKTVAPE
jgi:predicted RNA-binding Zn-ribbon protein involved in translation (DUF1610 family)